MDVAYYLSELLGQHGEVNVPGLGNFTQQKIDGYYSDEERKFYPPGSQVHFNSHVIYDDLLAEYIAEQKKISQASSKYFIEKFVNNLKAQVMSKDVPLADLGSLHFEETGIAFKSAGPLVNNPSFFGYPQIILEKISNTSAYDQLEPFSITPKEETAPPMLQDAVTAEPKTFSSEMEDYLRSLEADADEKPVQAGGLEPAQNTTFIPEVTEYSPEPYQPVPEPYVPPAPAVKPSPPPEEEFVFDGKGYDNVDGTIEKKSNKWLWICLAMIIVLAAAGAFLYYQQQQAGKVVKTAPVAPKVSLKTDTTKVVAATDTAEDSTKAVVIKDTTQKTVTAPAPAVPALNDAAPAIDSTKVRYEIMGSSANTLKEANTILRNYKSLNIDAHIAENVPGRKIQISLGTFMKRSEAVKEKIELLKTGKVQKDIYIQPINPKK